MSLVRLKSNYNRIIIPFHAEVIYGTNIQFCKGETYRTSGLKKYKCTLKFDSLFDKFCQTMLQLQLPVTHIVSAKPTTALYD